MRLRASARRAPHRAEWLEQMIFLANTVLPAMRDWFYAGTDGDAAGADAVQAIARRRLEAAWDRLDAHMQGGRSLTWSASGISTADFLAVMLMRWTRNMPKPATTWPNLEPYIERMRAMPSFIEVNLREGLTDWLNG